VSTGLRHPSKVDISGSRTPQIVILPSIIRRRCRTFFQSDFVLSPAVPLNPVPVFFMPDRAFLTITSSSAGSRNTGHVECIRDRKSWSRSAQIL